MRKSAIIGILAAATMSLGACATSDRYGYDDRYGDRYGYDNNNRQIGRAAAGAAIGAAAGAGVGAVVDGVSVGEGAAVGGLAGATIGAVTSGNDRRWYRDDRGYCFYVNGRGERIYDYDARC